MRRVSVGSGPARAAMGLTRRIGQELLRSGTYSSLGGDALPYAKPTPSSKVTTGPNLQEELAALPDSSVARRII